MRQVSKKRISRIKIATKATGKTCSQSRFGKIRQFLCFFPKIPQPFLEKKTFSTDGFCVSLQNYQLLAIFFFPLLHFLPIFGKITAQPRKRTKK